MTAAASLSDVVPALATAWRNLAAYPAGHPARTRALDAAHARLSALIAAAGPLALGVTREGLAYGETRLASPPALALAEGLRRRGVAMLRFEDGVAREEVERFLARLGDPRDRAPRPPLALELEQDGVARIVLESVDFGALALGEAAPGKRPPESLWDAILDALLTGKQLAADGRAAVGGEAYSAEGVAALFAGSGPAGNIETLAAAVGAHLREARGSARELAAHQVAELVRALPASVRRQVLAAAFKALAEEEAEAPRLDTLADALPPDEVLSALRQLSQQGFRLSPHALRLVHALSLEAARARAASAPGPADLSGAVAELGALFREEDIDRWNPEDHQQLLEQAAAIDFASLSPAPQATPLGERAASLEAEALQRQLAITLLELAASGQALADPLLRLERLIGEALAEGRLELAVAIVKDVRELVGAGGPAAARDAMGTFLERVAGSRQVLGMIGSMGQLSEADGASVRELISLLGSAAAGSLLRALAEEKNQSRRRRLFDVLASLGESIVPEARPLLADGRWYVVRNVLALLRAVGDRSSLDEVRRCAEASDLRVRLEAIKTLLAFDSGVPADLLAKAILDPDPKLAETAVVLAGQYGIQEARDLLLALVLRWDFFGAQRSLRLKALRALADLADPSVLPRLGRFFSDWRLPLVALEERRAAYKLLESYPEEARHPYVARGLQSRDPAIRSACQRLLRLSKQAPRSPGPEEEP